VRLFSAGWLAFAGGTQASSPVQTLALCHNLCAHTQASVGKSCHGNLPQKVQTKCTILHLDSQQDRRVLFRDFRVESWVELPGQTVIASGLPVEQVVPGQQSAAIAAKAGAPYSPAVRSLEIYK
jgi:hypothetical protein